MICIVVTLIFLTVLTLPIFLHFHKLDTASGLSFKENSSALWRTIFHQQNVGLDTTEIKSMKRSSWYQISCLCLGIYGGENTDLQNVQKLNRGFASHWIESDIAGGKTESLWLLHSVNVSLMHDIVPLVSISASGYKIKYYMQTSSG